MEAHAGRWTTGWLVAVLWAVAQPGNAALVNGIEAVVHDTVITRQDVQQMTAPAVPVLRRQYGGQEQVILNKLAEADRDNLEQLTQRHLILHDFKTSGFNLPESVLDDLVQDRIRSRYGDRRTLTKSLQAEGITFEKFRERLREQFVVEAMRNKNVASEIIISPQKIESYYAANREQFKVEDQVKLRMIVLNKTAEANAPDPKRLAEEILLKVKEGTAFSELAAIYSQRQQKDNTGEWFDKSDLRKELAEATAKLKAGDVTGVIDTPEACYLLAVEEVKPEHYRPLPEVRQAIESSLLVQERTRLEKQWVDRLKKKTFVRYY
jgi:peptidyl-prolyl cis-trans isomerase SurA